ncbi:MAG: hypothetical protein AAFO89_01460 [Planctomycetota bacterium]
MLTAPTLCLALLAADESQFLTNPVQLTFAEDFVKAGESYFPSDFQGGIVFQGVPAPAQGEEPGEHYDMYLALFKPLSYPGNPDGHRIALTEPLRISPEGSANTCGWFAPVETWNRPYVGVIFGSTLTPPDAANVPGYQRGTGRYQWSFPSEMEIVRADIDWSIEASISVTLEDGEAVSSEPIAATHDAKVHSLKTVFEKPGYTAECSYSPDGRHVLYANVDEAKSNKLGRADADLWIYDTETQEHTLIVEAEGYDGGPFFSPDGTWICYRSDRRGDNLLQLFVAELEFDDTGAITGIKREVQLTNNRHVNWAPFFHPSGDFLVYASSEVSHRNYEVFAIAFDDENPEPTTPVRITLADGFDGLPVFNPDGSKMMWTAQRGDDTQWGGRASSQLWIADFDADAVREALAEANPTDESE